MEQASADNLYKTLMFRIPDLRIDRTEFTGALIRTDSPGWPHWYKPFEREKERPLRYDGKISTQFTKHNLELQFLVDPRRMFARQQLRLYGLYNALRRLTDKKFQYDLAAEDLRKDPEVREILIGDLRKDPEKDRILTDRLFAFALIARLQKTVIVEDACQYERTTNLPILIVENWANLEDSERRAIEKWEDRHKTESMELIDYSAKATTMGSRVFSLLNLP